VNVGSRPVTAGSGNRAKARPAVAKVPPKPKPESWQKRAVALPEPDETADEVALFLRLVEAADDTDRLREIAESAGRELAPQELRKLYQQIEVLPDQEKVQRFRLRAPGWQLFLRKQPPVFSNTRLSTHARFFESVGAPKPIKTLLVLFAGRGGEAFMPTSRLLARLPLGMFDVLRVRADSDGDYPCGVPGLGTNFFDLCTSIRELAAPYVGSAALGASLGGFAALRAAVMAEMQVAISLSGRFTLLRPQDRSTMVAAFDPLCGCMKAAAPRLIAFHAAAHKVDALHAQKLAAIAPRVHHVAVPDVENHNVVAQLTAVGALDQLFEDLREYSLPRRP